MNDDDLTADEFDRRMTAGTPVDVDVSLSRRSNERGTHVTDIELQRQALKREKPELYAYLTAHEVAKALDAAGDAASSADDARAAAHRVWTTAAAHRGLASRLRNESNGDR